ncbi:MAG: hypothetical protein CVV51_00525 [Spirochaetae bacterium HGW-Spirochaetae-7]|nr:MAG: hypothetical protein CVV51_00525 [Spirochaetae bacterium HGW-Spirochaetae-7]
MKTGGEAWEVVNLPALAEEGDILGRPEGDPLWPERYPLESLEGIRRAVGPASPDSDLILIDLFRERAETVKHMQIMDSLWVKWRPKFQAVENETFGLSIIQELKRRGRPVLPC